MGHSGDQDHWVPLLRWTCAELQNLGGVQVLRIALLGVLLPGQCWVLSAAGCEEMCEALSL